MSRHELSHKEIIVTLVRTVTNVRQSTVYMNLYLASYKSIGLLLFTNKSGQSRMIAVDDVNKHNGSHADAITCLHEGLRQQPTTLSRLVHCKRGSGGF